MAVDARSGNGLDLAPSRALFRANLRWVGRDPYDVAPDGQSFVIIEALPDEAAAQPIALVIDWTEGLALKRQSP